MHRCIHAIVHLIQDHADRLDLPARFCATKLIEGDDTMADQLGLDQNEKDLLEHCIVQMETETGLDRNAALADMRYTLYRERGGRRGGEVPREPGTPPQRGAGQGADRQIHGAAGVFRRDAADVLADVQRHRAGLSDLLARGID